MIIVKIINKETLEIVNSYVGPAQAMGGLWGTDKYLHLEVPEEMNEKAVEASEIDGEIVLSENAEKLSEVQEAEAKIAAEKAGEARRKFKQDLEDKILLFNSSILNSTAEVEAYLNNSEIAALNKLISALSFGTALIKLNESDLSSYYSENQIQELKNMIANFLSANA